ncbi:MAG: HAD-IC family P-type ATPase [Acidimicrobiales bacterium]
MDYGLTDEEVDERRRLGQVNDVQLVSSRTIAAILRANLLTRFNALLGFLFVVILVVGPVQDALFGGVLVANSIIGIVQELRAKRTLDRLVLLVTPSARVVRSGQVQDLNVHEVVLDDVIEVGAGDPIVVDGELVVALGIEVDESLLTGEVEPRMAQVGDRLLSGSFVVAGTGRYRAVQVGAAAYANQLTFEARRFTLVSSELRASLDRILRMVSWMIVPVAAVLMVSQLSAHDSAIEALRGSVAGVVAMVPEGLVLLTSVAFAASVVRLGRHNVLVQELPAVETLARVDVVCIDKTGTLTEGQMELTALEPLPGGDQETWRDALAALVACDPNPNATLRAIGTGMGPGPGWETIAVTPFSSERKWSAAVFELNQTWVLGAPEVLLASSQDGDSSISRSISMEGVWERSQVLASEGRRVLLLAHTTQLLDGTNLPSGLKPIALAILEDRVRSDAPNTIRYFNDQGVAVKIISGDNPLTVAAVAARAGVDVGGGAIDGRDLPDEIGSLADILDAHSVFGRVSPHQKQAMVTALQSRGHVVAMTGDGVNDVLALKNADLGIAMGSGSAAGRAVAQIVLLDSNFATLPQIVAEGRRVLGNIERVAKLFVTKTVYAFLLAIAVGIAQLPFPFLPRHLTLVGSLTIGIPAFFLALSPMSQRARPDFIPRVLSFAGPAGVFAAAATFTTFAVARLYLDAPMAEARTAATFTLFSLGLMVLARLAAPLTVSYKALIAALAIAGLVVVIGPEIRTFFDLDVPSLPLILVAIGTVALAVQALTFVERVLHWFPATERLLGHER